MHFSMSPRTMDTALPGPSLTWHSGLQMSVACAVEAGWTRTWHLGKRLTSAYTTKKMGQHAGCTRDLHLFRGSLHVRDCSTCCTFTHLGPLCMQHSQKTSRKSRVASRHARTDGPHSPAPAPAHEQAWYRTATEAMQGAAWGWM